MVRGAKLHQTGALNPHEIIVMPTQTLSEEDREYAVTRFPYEIARLAQDIAGGLLVTLPSGKDFANPEIGPYLEKYLRGAEQYATEERWWMLRLVENLMLGPGAAAYLTESMHGAGSPQAQRIMLARLADLEAKVRYARRLAGVKDKAVQ